MTVFLDACTVIYLIEAREPFYSSCQDAFRKLAEADPDLSVAISRLSILECLVQPLKNQEEETIEQYRDFFSRKGLSIIDISPEVIEKALLLRVNFNLRTPDALQGACALSLTDDTVFLTGDRSFLKIPALKVSII